jgi:phosphate transport system substrate-binding protein
MQNNDEPKTSLEDLTVKLTRFPRAAVALTAAALLLTACGSDDNGNANAAGDGSTAAPSSDSCLAGTLNAEGSSAQQNAIDEVIASYTAECADTTINYNPTGSGAGVEQFNAGQVDFAGSDSALKEDEGEVAAAKERCNGNDAWNIPMVVGPIAMAYNLDGVDKLVLTPEVAAKLFKGDITKWNDPAIKALNPDAALPSTDIKVFFRSDESGTTENFQKYLAGAGGGAWTDEPSKVWPGAGEGREKSSGVADGVKTTPDSITYVEWSYAKDNALGIAQVDNGAGPVELTGGSVGAAVASAKSVGTGNDLRLELDYATQTAGAYPIVLVTYEIACSKGLPADKAKLVKSFLTYFASADTQASLEEIGYAPLPDEVSTKVATAIEALA